MRCFYERVRGRRINCTIVKRTKKVVAYERIFTPGIGRHLSHNLISAQIQTAKQQQWRTDAAVVRFDRKETRLTFPSGLTQGHRDIIRVDRPRKLQLPSILNPVLNSIFRSLQAS
jgi:hypothetical protein